MDLWTRCLPNISLQMKRRSYLFTEKLNDDTLLFIDKETQSPIILIFIQQEKVGVDVLKHYITKCMNSNVKHYILIYQSHMTTMSIKIINNFFDTCIEYYPLKNYLYDVTKSRYYIHHEKINNEQEKNEIKSTFGSKLPIILSSDPIVKYYGFKKKDVLRIHRKDNEIFYREVK